MAKETAEIELESIRQDINLLASHPNTDLNSLNRKDPIYRAFERVKTTSNLMYDTDTYQYLSKMVAELPCPKEKFKYGTCGAFLFGCRQTNYGDVGNKYCSPYCTQGFQLDKDSGKCEYQVWVKEQGKPITRYHQNYVNKFPVAYIYSSKSFEGLTSNDLESLRKAGVENAIVYSTDDCKHRVLVKSTKIEELVSKKTKEAPQTGQSNGTIWVIIALIVIGLILFGIWFRQRAVALQ